MTTTEAAVKLQVSSRRVRAMIGAGHLTARMIGRDWCIEPVALKAGENRKPGRPRK